MTARPARCALLLAGLVCGIAAAQPQPQLRPPAAATAWRAPTLVVTGAAQPVRLSALKLDLDIAAGVAMTRVQMEFYNPNSRVLEGKLQFPLAPGQVVSGFALDVDGKLRDAVPIEKARGQQVFEDIARRRVDPGLLQTTLGNNYELRVYPLNPGKTRTVVLTLLEPASARLLVPLAYASKVDRFELSVRSAGAKPTLGGAANIAALRFEREGSGYVARLRSHDATLPAQPLTLELPTSNELEVAIGSRGDGRYFTAAFPVSTRTAARVLPKRVQIVWDSSGSGGQRRIDRELDLLAAYFERAGEIEVSLVRFADTAAPAERFSVHRGDWSALRKSLEATVYDGASNLGAVRHDGVASEALWFSDGLANYGSAWQPGFAVPVYAINSGTSSDPAALQALAERSGGRSIDLGLMSRRAAAEALLTRGSDVVRVSAVGARDLVVQPGSAAGGRVVVAGSLIDRSAEVTVVVREAAGATTTRVVHVDAGAQETPLAALQWARLSLASLEAEARTNKSRIRDLGRRFGLATRETSLIVLEQLDDYVRYEIEPPSELRASYERQLATQRTNKQASDNTRLAEVVRRWQARVDWWNRDFPKETSAPLQISRAESQQRAVAATVAPPAPALTPAPTPPRDGNANRDVLRSARVGEIDRAQAPDNELAKSRAMESAADGRAPAGAMSRAAAPRPASIANAFASAGTLADDKVAGKSGGTAQIAIALTAASRGSAAVKRLQAALPAERQRVYLDDRPGNVNNVGYFLDVADFFLAQKGADSHAAGLRVLSNLAELDLQNRDVLRLLGYRLQQAGEAALAVPVFERVLELAPHEPQSQRDLGLALDLAGQPQAAIEHLYEVVTGRWDARFPDVELIALEELNAIVARPHRGDPGLDTSRIDKRLLKALPLDLRVVLSWDADNTDVDLHVIDPNGEEVYYSHPLSLQGGAITRDATGGYGPEEFALRVAKPGKYRVEANFFGHRQQVLTTNTGLMLWLSSGFATAAQKDQRTTLRVASERGERVVVGEFEVKR